MQLSYEHDLRYNGFQLLSAWIFCISELHLRPAPTFSFLPPPLNWAAVALGRGGGWVQLELTDTLVQTH